jgi:hypothetical protein
LLSEYLVSLFEMLIKLCDETQKYVAVLFFDNPLAQFLDSVVEFLGHGSAPS